MKLEEENQKILKFKDSILRTKLIYSLSFILITLHTLLWTYYWSYKRIIPDNYPSYLNVRASNTISCAIDLFIPFYNYTITLALSIYASTQKSSNLAIDIPIQCLFILSIFFYGNHPLQNILNYSNITGKYEGPGYFSLFIVFFSLICVLKLTPFIFLFHPFYGLLLEFIDLTSSSIIVFLKENAIHIGSLNTKVSDILEEFFQHTNFERSNLLITDYHFGDKNTMMRFDFINFACNHIINIPKRLFTEDYDSDLLKFELYREYAYTVCHRQLIFATLRIFKYICIAIFLIKSIIRQKDTTPIPSSDSSDTRIYLKNAVYISFFSTIFELLMNLISMYIELKADDISTRMIGNLIGFSNHCRVYSKNFRDDKSKYLICYPPYFPAYSKPSLLQRYNRQNKIFNK